MELKKVGSQNKNKGAKAHLLNITTHPLIFARSHWLLYGTFYQAIAPVYADICPPMISIAKNQSQQKKSQPESFHFHLYYLTWKKNELVS